MDEVLCHKVGYLFRGRSRDLPSAMRVRYSTGSFIGKTDYLTLLTQHWTSLDAIDSS